MRYISSVNCSITVIFLCQLFKHIVFSGICYFTVNLISTPQYFHFIPFIFKICNNNKLLIMFASSTYGCYTDQWSPTC